MREKYAMSQNCVCVDTRIAADCTHVAIEILLKMSLRHSLLLKKE